MKSKFSIILGLTVFFAALLIVATDTAQGRARGKKGNKGKYWIPIGLKGFSGMLKGKIVKKTDKGFILEVRKVTNVWKNNKARQPRSAVGKRFNVVVSNIKKKKEGHPLRKLQRLWVKSLKTGDVITVELTHTGGKKLVIMELTEAQMKIALKAAGGSKDKGKGKTPKLDFPDDFRKFSGMLRGKVVDDDKQGFYLKVYKVLKVWKNNKADDPKSIIGKIVLVKTGWKKGRDKKWHPIEMHMKFIKTLKIGDEISIEVRHYEGDKLNILELSEEQRKIARSGKGGGEGEKRPDPKKATIPDGLKGFQGLLRGKVVRKTEHGFWLKVTLVVSQWKNSKAKNAKSVEGKEVLILAQWRKKGDDWRADESHMHFIGKIRNGRDVIIDVINDEGEQLHILELTKEQSK